MKPPLIIAKGRLRPITRDDADTMIQLITLPKVRRFLCDDKTLTSAEVSAILSESENNAARGLGLWVIETDGAARAGFVGLMPVSRPLTSSPAMKSGIEPIIALDPRFWGQGLAREALIAVIEYARSALHLTRLVAAVDAPNLPSHRLLRACGFEACGKTTGTAHDLLLYSLSLRKTEAF